MLLNNAFLLLLKYFTRHILYVSSYKKHEFISLTKTLLYLIQKASFLIGDSFELMVVVSFSISLKLTVYDFKKIKVSPVVERFRVSFVYRVVVHVEDMVPVHVIST